MASFEVANVIEAAKLKIRGRPKGRLSAQQKVTSTYGIDGGSTLWYDGICEWWSGTGDDVTMGAPGCNTYVGLRVDRIQCASQRPRLTPQ